MRKRSATFEKQLLAYSTAAGAVLAGASSSTADVIVTNINTTLTWTGSGYVDLLVNGSSKFRVNLTIQKTFSSSTWFTSANFGISARTAGAFWRRAGSFQAARLALDDWVRTGLWSNAQYNRNMANAFWVSGSLSAFGGQFAKTNGYLGLRFLVGGVTNYGWASVTVSPNMQSYTIHQFAYDNTGANIQAGVIPEPTSLSLLALGAAGLLAFRRARKQAQP